MRQQIYIIDDDESFGRSLKRLLGSKGLQADCFESAQAFLDSVPSGQKGTAIVDINMPGYDGFALMDKMRELHYEMPVIVITGQAKAASRDLALKRGAKAFLQKPFSDESLMALIEDR